MPMDIGKAVVATLEAVGQLFVVKSKEVHPGGLEVVNMDRIFSNTEAQVIRLTVHMPTFDSTASHDHGVAIREVITTQYFTF